MENDKNIEGYVRMLHNILNVIRMMYWEFCSMVLEMLSILNDYIIGFYSVNLYENILILNLILLNEVSPRIGTAYLNRLNDT